METITEKYMGADKAFNTKVNELIDEINKSRPKNKFDRWKKRQDQLYYNFLSLVYEMLSLTFYNVFSFIFFIRSPLAQKTAIILACMNFVLAITI